MDRHSKLIFMSSAFFGAGINSTSLCVKLKTEKREKKRKRKEGKRRSEGVVAPKDQLIHLGFQMNESSVCALQLADCFIFSHSASIPFSNHLLSGSTRIDRQPLEHSLLSDLLVRNHAGDNRVHNERRQDLRPAPSCLRLLCPRESRHIATSL